MKTSTMGRAAAILALAALLVGMAPSRAGATAGTGRFESTTFGVTISWDEEVWTGTEADLGDAGEGVAFESLSSFGQIQAVHSTNVDAEDCLQNMADSFAEDDGTQIEDFGVAPRRLERPEGIDGGAGELYTYTFIGSDGNLDTALYLGCAALPDDLGALQIILSAETDIYPDVVQEWTDLIGGIRVGGDAAPSGTDKPGKTSKPTTGIHGDIYTNAELGFSLAWDGDFWTADEVANGNAQGVELDAGSSYAYIAATTDKNARDAESCYEALVANLKTTDDFSRVRVASKNLERPETERHAVGDLYSFTTAKDGTKMVAYLECRPLAIEGVLALQFAANQEDYESELPQWQAVLDSIDLEAGAADEPTATPDDAGDEPAEAATIAGPNFGVAIAYDDTIWTANDYSDGSTDQIGFDSDYGNVQVLTVVTNADLGGCVQTLADNEVQYTTDGLTVAPRTLERPQTSRGAVSELYTMTIDGQSGGPIDALFYVECRQAPDGGGVVAVSFTTVPGVWDDALGALEQLLAGIDA